MKAYIKVKCSDELPKYNQFVHIIHDGGLIGFGFYSQNEKDWFDDESAYLNHVEYWLKEVTIPDEEEIRNSVPYKGSLSRYQIGKNVGFIRGAKWLLSKLK